MNHYWQSLMQFCLLRYGINPSAFWQLSVPELEMLYALIESQGGPASMERETVTELMRTYPDLPSTTAAKEMET